MGLLLGTFEGHLLSSFSQRSGQFFPSSIAHIGGPSVGMCKELYIYISNIYICVCVCTSRAGVYDLWLQGKSM